MNGALYHLDCSRTYVRMLFHYSSAFNIIPPDKLEGKLTDLGVPPTACNWILDFLMDRQQVVKMGDKVLAQLTVSTGSLRGSCLSPKLFTLYTSESFSTREDTIIIKYANDKTNLGLIEGGHESVYREKVNSILDYGEENDLILSVGKTKELIMDFRKKACPQQDINIKGTVVERADCHRFLTLQVAANLSWPLNTTATVKKAQQCLYFIRLLRKADLSHRPLTQAYKGLVKSILTNDGNTTQTERKALQRVIKTAERIIKIKIPFHGHDIHTMLQEGSTRHHKRNTPSSTHTPEEQTVNIQSQMQ
ncbi:uncharacterized protein LOC121654536 [Melanotaenia boesemani]|uniref:uncharacterized protein LOC121654536 n=1 Tax=Melanotaenia boesemani TaxID=1250792 RepID=UPI001C05B8C4|nr:uncharacterized protein LOC121654536 [Melanotaenia boesemani]